MARIIGILFFSFYFLLMFNYYGIVDKNYYRLFFLFLSTISFGVLVKYNFRLLKKYNFLYFSLIITCICFFQIIRSYTRGLGIEVVLANAQNFLFYLSTFFLVYIIVKFGVKNVLYSLIIPLLFLIITFYYSKYFTPLFKVGGSRDFSNFNYQRIYFHGYQLSIFGFFFIASTLRFFTFKINHKIGIIILVTIFLFILFLSYFRAFFLGPIIIILLFYTGNNFKKKIAYGLIALVLLYFIVKLFPALADRYLVVFDEGISDDPTSLGRLIIFLIRFQFLLDNNSLFFGDGFMLPKEDYTLYTLEERISNPLIFDNDNGYAGLLVATGFLGVIIMIYCHIKSALQYYSFYKKTQTPLYKSIYFTAYVFSIYVILISFVNDFFIFPYALMVVVFVNALAIAAKEEELIK
jgi:hypothetical protein